MENVTIMTREELNDMLEANGDHCFSWLGEMEHGGLLYSMWQSNLSGRRYATRLTRRVHMGFNSNEPGTVERFVEIVEREGSCEASWGVTGRTKHSMLGWQLAALLPQYDWEITDNYGCIARKK